ncbi:mobilization protein [Streptomyces sp. L7]
MRDHTDPHLVASFDGRPPDPGRGTNATLKDLQQPPGPARDGPAEARASGQARPGHTSVRATADDRILSDEEWAARSPGGSWPPPVSTPATAQPGCRPGRRSTRMTTSTSSPPSCARTAPAPTTGPASAPRPNAASSRSELGLHQANAGDGTAAQRPTSAERHKAERQGRSSAPREKNCARACAARRPARAGEEEFFDRLGRRRAPRSVPSGSRPPATCSAARSRLPDDRNKDDGARLLPRRAPSHPTCPGPASGSAGPPTATTRTSVPRPVRRSARRRTGPSAARRRTASAAWQAVLVIDYGDDAQVAAAHIASCRRGPGRPRQNVRRPHPSRTARGRLRVRAVPPCLHVQAERGHDRAPAPGRPRPRPQRPRPRPRARIGATTAMAIDMLFFVVTAAAHWHAKKGPCPAGRCCQPGGLNICAPLHSVGRRPAARRPLPARPIPRAPLLQRQTAVLREALPRLAGGSSPSPAGTRSPPPLTDAETAGHDPATLLADAASRRELGTAESASDVLVWRLRRAAGRCRRHFQHHRQRRPPAR